MKINITKPVWAQFKQALAAIFLIAHASSALAQPLPDEASIPYIIKSGDKLIRLSAELLRQPSDWPEVARFNQLKNPNALKPGQTIQVPVRLMKSTPLGGKIVSVSGEVQLGTTRAEAGNALAEGARLQTGANSSAVIELADGSRMTLLPNTLAELATSRGYGARGRGTSASTTWFSGLVRLVQGSLDTAAARFAKRATPLQIQTPTSLVGVRGTQFRVAYDDPATQNARTEVLEGLVRADNPAQGNGAAIEKGKGAVLNPAVRDILVVDLLKAPDLSATPAEILKPLALWPMPALDGAARFRVQVASDASFNAIVRDLVVTTGAADFASLPDGHWFARLRGIDAGGIEGYDSVKTVQVRLPPPRQWTVGSNRIDVSGGRHVLRFLQQGLDASDTITATVSREQAPNPPVTQTSANADTAEIGLDLGMLDAGVPYLIRMTVARRDGTQVVPLMYRLVGLNGSGWVRDRLELVKP